jgi:hypothetical protein
MKFTIQKILTTRQASKGVVIECATEEEAVMRAKNYQYEFPEPPTGGIGDVYEINTRPVQS